MGSQSNQGSLRILDQAQFLSGSTVTHLPLVSTRLSETYGGITPIVDGEGNTRVTEWDLVQLANVGLLAQASRVALETSQIYRERKARLSDFYRLRGEGVTELSRLHSRQRKAFLGSYGAEWLRLVGLEVPGSMTYAAVRARCQDSSRRMRNRGSLGQIGSPRPGTPEIDFGLLAQGMEDALQTYDGLVNNVETGLKLRDEAFVAHKEAEDQLRRVYVNVARVQEGFYRLAGLDELANRIRVTIPVRKPVSDVEPVAEPGVDPVSEPTP